MLNMHIKKIEREILMKKQEKREKKTNNNMKI
jgi:hypothetical protein